MYSGFRLSRRPSRAAPPTDDAPLRLRSRRIEWAPSAVGPGAECQRASRKPEFSSRQRSDLPTRVRFSRQGDHVAWIITKYMLSAAVVVLVSELAKRSDRLGGFVAALPLVTVLALIWLYVENQPQDKIANHAWYTFWYVVPTLPIFWHSRHFSRVSVSGRRCSPASSSPLFASLSLLSQFAALV